MRITGVITEYNPFHNGHLYHLQQTRTLTTPDLIVAVMSGHFVQRGEPAIIDKWSRAKMALNSGADVVVELPTVFACHSAAEFAAGAVRMLQACAVDTFVFGAEDACLSNLSQVASILVTEPPQYKKTLRSFLNQGYSFAYARAKAASAIYAPAEDILRESNNILAINYLVALQKYQLTMQPKAIVRRGASYNSTQLTSVYSSASAIRQGLLEDESIRAFVPDATFQILQQGMQDKRAPITWAQFSDVLLLLLRRITVAELEQYPDMEIGLSNRLKDYAYQVDSVNAFIAKVTCKRYPSTRIKRILTRLLLGIDKSIDQKTKDVRNLPYIRILGLRQASSQRIKMWKQLVNASLIQQPARYCPELDVAKTLWEIDLRATDLYVLGSQDQNLRIKRQDFCHPLVIV